MFPSFLFCCCSVFDVFIVLFFCSFLRVILLMLFCFVIFRFIILFWCVVVVCLFLGCFVCLVWLGFRFGGRGVDGGVGGGLLFGFLWGRRAERGRDWLYSLC